MATMLTADTKGVFVIAATPFRDDGRVDEHSIDTLVDFYLRCGVDGMTILGVMGEAHKLSADEAVRVTQRFLNRVDGKVPVIVGVSNPGMTQLVNLSRASMDAGAAGVMIQPIAGLKTDNAVRGYMRGVIGMLGPDIRVCMQDYPQLTNVYFSAETFVTIVDELPSVVVFKHEEWPGMSKLTAIRQACNGNERRYVPILCGNGGLHLPQEYLRGADGAMTGFAYPDMLVQMDRLFRAGKEDEGEDLYDKYLPLLRHEFQVGLGLAIRKEILRRRGALSSAYVRPQGPKLDATDIAELDRLLTRLDQKLAA